MHDCMVNIFVTNSALAWNDLKLFGYATLAVASLLASRLCVQNTYPGILVHKIAVFYVTVCGHTGRVSSELNLNYQSFIQ